MLDPIKTISTVWSLFSRKRKIQTLSLIALMFLSSITEVLSIGAVVPFLAAISDLDATFDVLQRFEFFRHFNLVEPFEILAPLTFFFIASICLAGFMRFATLLVQTKLSYWIGGDFSRSIFKGLLSRSYSYHLDNNSSQSVSAIVKKTDLVAGGVVLPSLAIVNAFLLSTFIISALILINPLPALSLIFIFGLIYLVIVYFVRKKLTEYSHIINNNQDSIVKVVQETIAGIKDIILGNSGKFFADIFRSRDTKLRSALASAHILANSPKFIIETIGICFIAIYSFFALSGHRDDISVIPTLGALALGAQRLLPVFQNAFASWATITSNEKTTQEVCKLLRNSTPNATSKEDMTISFEKSICLEKVNFCYGQKDREILRDISITIAKGSKIGIIGESGGGKSTILDLLMGLHHPSSGRLTVDGKEITKENRKLWYDNVSHVPQDIYVTDSSICENIAFGVALSHIDMARVNAVAKAVRLERTISRFEKGILEPVGENGAWLSGGEKQRIGIARALYLNKQVLILDEATSDLDSKTETAVIKSIAALDEFVTIIMVAHRLSSLRDCDKIIRVANGMLDDVVSYQEVVLNDSN